MKPSFHGALKENPNSKFISAPVMNCPAGESDKLCGMRGQGSSISATSQAERWAGSYQNGAWGAATEHAAERLWVSLPWTNTNTATASSAQQGNKRTSFQ